MKESVFDLALVAAVKVILHAPLISYLETVTYSQIQDPFNRKINIIKRILHLVHIMFSLAILAYTTTKGALILNAYLNDKDYQIMHPSYNALTISAIAFTLIEFGVFLFSYRAMRQLKVIRVLHLYNDDGQEVDKEGNPIKKKVDIKRLITLAKPVSSSRFKKKYFCWLYLLRGVEIAKFYICFIQLLDHCLVMPPTGSYLR